MKVLFAASECVPFVKTGGLADVVGALPKELLKQGADVRVILPLYREMGSEWRDKLEHMLYFYINLGWRRQYCGIEKIVHEGVTFYFIDNEYYFGRSYIYGLGGDEGERFAFFCRAVLEALPQIDFIPDVLHCHDWQTGLIPALLNAQYRMLPQYSNIRTVFTIHNLQYQGIFPIGDIEDLLSLGGWAYDRDHLEFYGQCSFMKGGLVFANAITTVSPTYSQEIQTAYYGEKLDGLLRARANSLTGILNGIDTVEYNPQTDPLIPHRYSVETFGEKVQNKLALQKELELQENANVPMIGMVSRLSGQKGLDLVERVLDEIMATGVQLVVLGKGEEKYVDLFSWAQWKYPGRIAARIEMNHTLAHKIYAASDLFLMPSMFEPCGLSQMIAMRYGSLPIVRETGGLRDTVLSYNDFTGEGSGFTFFNYNAHDMLHVIERAVYFYNQRRDVFNAMAVKDMQGSYGWDRSAKVYMELYNRIAVNGVQQVQPKQTSEEKAEGEAKVSAKAGDVEKKVSRAKKTEGKTKAAANTSNAEKKVSGAKKTTSGKTAAKKPRTAKKTDGKVK